MSERLKIAHEKIRNNATAAQLKIMDAVDSIFEVEAAELSQRIDKEDELRKWAADLCGRRSVSVTELEELLATAKRAKPGSAFAALGTVLFKTSFGTVDRLDRYVITLEKTVIDITNNSQFTALGFRGLIKMAFTNLFRRK